MEALAKVQIDIGVLERRDDDVDLGAHDGVGVVAADQRGVEVRIVALSRELVAPIEEEHVAAHPGFEARPFAEENLLLQKSAEGPLFHVQLVDGEKMEKKALTLHLPMQGDVDAVVAILHGDLRLLWNVRQRPITSVLGAQAVQEPLIVLLDAVAGNVRRPGDLRATGIDDAGVRLDEAEASSHGIARRCRIAPPRRRR